MDAFLIPGSNPASARFADSEVINGHLYVAGRLVESLPERPRRQRTRRAETLHEGPVVILNPDRKRQQFLVLVGGAWTICYAGKISRDPSRLPEEGCWFDCARDSVVCWHGEEAAAVALHELPKALKLLEIAEIELCNIADRVPVAPAQYVRAAIACLKPAVAS